MSLLGQFFLFVLQLLENLQIQTGQCHLSLSLLISFFFISFFFQSMHNLNVCCFSSSEMASKLLFITPGFMPLGSHNRFDCKTGLGGTEKLSLEHENGSLDAKCITDVSPDINRKNFPWNGVIPIRQNCFISSEYRICLWFSALKSLTTSRNNRYDICFGLNVF